VKLEDCVGLTLEEARATLASANAEAAGVARNELRVEVVETAPPVRPPKRADNRTPRKVKPQPATPTKATGQQQTVPGQWRVLRARETPEGSIELLVAREELRAVADAEAATDVSVTDTAAADAAIIE
jgi:hypothetical protein